VVISERHLQGILSKYVDYYNETRTHLSLAKDAPRPRTVQPPREGSVVKVPRVGGLHHEYLRKASACAVLRSGRSELFSIDGPMLAKPFTRATLAEMVRRMLDAG